MKYKARAYATVDYEFEFEFPDNPNDPNHWIDVDTEANRQAVLKINALGWATYVGGLASIVEPEDYDRR